MLARYPLIRTEVEASVLVAQRRWNMRLKGGIDVKLPDDDVEEALQTLVALDRTKKLLSRDILIVDLRQPDRVTVRLSDEAAAVRTEAMKPKKAGQGKGAPHDRAPFRPDPQDEAGIAQARRHWWPRSISAPARSSA